MLHEDWQRIALHESFELVKQDYRRRHGLTPSTGHAREISAPFTQARAYFASAATADRTVKPLLLYYGVASLTRGLTLSLARRRREANLAGKHGLTIKDWGAELSKSGSDFANLSVVVSTGGAFVELMEATGHRSLLRNNSSGINLAHAHPAVPGGSKIAVGDALSRIPSLRDHVLRWRGTIGCCQLIVMQTVDGDARIQIWKNTGPHVTRGYCDAIFAGTGFQFDLEAEASFVYRGPDDLDQFPGLTDCPGTAFTNIGDLWITAPHPEGLHLSKIGTLFLVSYCLGMLARYFPTQWTALVRSQIGDAALPALGAAIDLIETEYPRLVLEFLEEKPLGDE